VEVSLPGRTTIFFPKYISREGRSVLTLEWEGNTFLFQLDRKFDSIADGGIRSLELTEIKPTDADTNYFA
jgi:hypothetical protein